MRKPVVLITGAGGEIGHGLIEQLAADGGRPIITLDLAPLEPGMNRMVAREFTGSIMDASLLEVIRSEFEVDTVFHLAALLSTRSEFSPLTAHSREPSSRQDGRLGLGHGRRLTVNEFHTAGRAAGLPAAGMQLIDLRVLLQGQHQALARFHVTRSHTFDSQFWH